MIRTLRSAARFLFGKSSGRPTPRDPATPAAFEAALAHHQQGELDKAEKLYDSVLARDPDHFGALNFAGVLAYQSGRPQRAVELLERACAADPGQPGAHSNLALALNAVGRGHDAIASCDRAILLDPACVEAYSNRGNSLWGLGRRDEALASYAAALALQPDHAQSHWNEGFLRLQLGQFDAGWPKQEWRWALPHMDADRRDWARPPWLGKEDIAGKTVLLHAEQGLGDTLLACRYARLVAARGATVVLEVQKPLKGLLANLEGPAQVLARGEPLPDFDYHCPLLSLPLAFGTTLETIPTEVGYVRCDPAEVEAWRARLGPATLPRVGLVWLGTTPARSMKLAELLPLLGSKVQFFSFQKDVSAEDQALLDAHPEVVQVDPGLRNFADAPLVSLMDAVITVDTSMAHLAGALGTPAWVLLAHNPDWRWMLGREDSPWYPRTRLFRQPAPEDWASVVARVAEALGALSARASCRG
jgi:Tfp pilus assembly protein PilF